MNAKAKRIVERLEQIKARAAELNAAQVTKSAGVSPVDLAEEAAALGLELADLLGKGK